MNKILYHGVTRPRKDGDDFAPCIQVTEETNGFALWEVDSDGCAMFYGFISRRDHAIELATARVFAQRKDHNLPQHMD